MICPPKLIIKLERFDLSFFAITNGKGACAYYRIIFPFKYMNFSTTCSYFASAKDNKILPKEAELIRQKAYGAKTIIIQRKHGPDWNSLIDFAKVHGNRVIYEFDDMFTRIPKETVAAYPHLADKNTEKAIFETIRKCDFVTVSTKELKVWLEKYDIESTVLQNFLPDLNIVMPFEERAIIKPYITIVWAGSIHHKRDLDMVSPIVKRIVERHNNVRFQFFGFITKTLAGIPRVSHILPVPFENYYKTLSEINPDIGLIPLEEIFFNKFKSNIKYLEFARVGAACIASDYGPYALIKHKTNGIKVKGNRYKNWINGIEYLLNKRNRLNIVDNASEFIKNWSRKRIITDYEEFYGQFI